MADSSSQRRLAIFDATPLTYGGGYEQFAQKLQRAAANCGWDAAVVVPSTSAFLRVATLLGVRKRFAHLAANPAPAHNWEFLASSTHAYVKNEHLDMLWWWFARGRGSRTVGFHTPLRYPADSMARILRNALYANPFYGALLSGSRLHLLNRYDYQALPKNARTLPAAIIPNGIEPREAPPDFHGMFNALFVGRLTVQKGLDRVVGSEIAAHAGPLTVIGDGPEAAPLRRQFTENATFLGAIAREDVIMQMRRHAILLMPSRWEGLPLTLLEAMSVGCVPVVSGIPALVDALPEDLRWLAVDFDSAGDVSEIVRRLRTMYGSREVWQGLREHLAGHVRQNYNEELQLAKLLTFIEMGNGAS